MASSCQSSLCSESTNYMLSHPVPICISVVPAPVQSNTNFYGARSGNLSRVTNGDAPDAPQSADVGRSRAPFWAGAHLHFRWHSTARKSFRIVPIATFLCVEFIAHHSVCDSFTLMAYRPKRHADKQFMASLNNGCRWDWDCVVSGPGDRGGFFEQNETVELCAATQITLSATLYMTTLLREE